MLEKPAAKCYNTFVKITAQPCGFRKAYTMRKTIATVLALALALGLWGCGDSEEGGRFQYDIPAAISSLDPQFATEDAAKSVLSNCMEGLLRQRADGSVSYALAEGSTTSADEKTHTFTLRQGLKWADGTPLTAHDFVFALRRHFGPGVVSPYAADFMMIENAKAVLAGEQPPSALGIEASDDYTLVIRLEAPSAFLGQLLSSTAALPCNEAFFQSTRGRYGTGPASLLSNGAFALTGWSEEKLTLQKNEKYYEAEGVLPQSVTFQIGREDPEQQLLSGRSHAGAIAHDRLKEAVEAGLTYEPFDNTVWALCFNQQKPAFADREMRAALQMSVDRQQLAEKLQEGFISTSQFIPPASLIFDKPYRQQAGQAVSPPYNPETARELFRQTLEAQGRKKLDSVTILVPERANQIYYASFIQQMWQRNLSLYVNIQQLPQQELSKKVAAGDYDIAILPFTSNRPDPSGLLGQFVSGAAGNLTGYADGEYDLTVSQAEASGTVQEMVRLFAKAEDLLLSEAVVVPLYFETTCFAMGKGVLGVEYSPYSGKLFFHHARLG